MKTNRIPRKQLFMMATVLLTAYGSSVFAKEKHVHREHGAHVHGDAKLAIAFDGASGKIEFSGAAEGILGWEHKARTKKDKETLAKAIAQFENGIGSMIRFDPSLQCKFKKELIGQVPEKGEEQSGEHSDWAANFQVACLKSPLQTRLTIDFSTFQLLKDVDITVLVDSVQKSAEAKGRSVQVDLK